MADGTNEIIARTHGKARKPALQVAVVTGGVQSPSRTRVLVDRIVEELRSIIQADVTVVDLAVIGKKIGALGSRNTRDAEVDAAYTAVEQADLLIAASPVYKASYTGLFKHFFDLLDQKALTGRPVLLAATGGSDRHALAIDHQFRPLFSFFGALTIPTAVYATDKDIIDRKFVNDALLDRVQRAVEEAARYAGALTKDRAESEGDAALQA